MMERAKLFRFTVEDERRLLAREFRLRQERELRLQLRNRRFLPIKRRP